MGEPLNRAKVLERLEELQTLLYKLNDGGPIAEHYMTVVSAIVFIRHDGEKAGEL